MTRSVHVSSNNNYKPKTADKAPHSPTHTTRTGPTEGILPHIPLGQAMSSAQDPTHPISPISLTNALPYDRLKDSGTKKSAGTEK